MKICPHINSKEWKLMVKHLGDEREAYRAYMAHGYTIPNAITKTQLKNKIGLSHFNSNEKLIGVHKKLRRYNEENGTSHFLDVKPTSESNEIFTANIVFNYLPVNKQKQTDRDNRRKMKGYIGLQDGESFENVYTPSESETEAGRFNDEGDFLPPIESYFPASKTYKAGPKFQAYIDKLEADIRTLYRKRNQLKLKSRNAKDAANLRSITDRIVRIEEDIDRRENEITELANKNILTDITSFAEEDMNTLEKIFSQKNPTVEDLNTARRIIKIWQKAGDFSGERPHLFYDPEEFASAETGLKEVTDKFIEWKRRANVYNNRLIEAEERIIQGNVEQTFGKDVSINFQEPWKDVSFLVKTFLDISETDSVVLQALHTWVKDANSAANLELEGMFDELDRLINNTGLTDFGIFQQTFDNESTEKTGEMVFRWTQSFFDWESQVNFERDRDMDNARNIADPSSQIKAMINANAEYINKLRENVTVFDPRILFWDAELTDAPEPTQEQRQQHEAELRKLLGDRGYESYYELNKEKIERYKLERQATMSMFQGEAGEDNALAISMFESWEAKHSPYVYAELIRSDKEYKSITHKGKHPYPSNKYLRIIPKKDEFFDNKFKEIEQNDSYRELYDYMFDMLQTLKLYLPREKVGFMQINSIPTLRKRAGEMMNDDGMSAAFNGIREEVTRSLRTSDLSEVGKSEERKDFQFDMLVNKQQAIKEYINLKEIEHRRDNDGALPTGVELRNLRQQWRREIMDQLAQEKSFDLGRIMKAFASMAITYKHRSAIEDKVRIVSEIVNRGIEQRTNDAGQPIRDKARNLLGREKGLTNMETMLNDFLDVAYWGYPSNRPQGQTSKKKLTSKEKVLQETLIQRKQELETLLSEEKITAVEYEKRMDIINDQLDVLGGVKTISKYGDVILKYIQLKGMGWNVFAGFANIGFGFISNVIEAADERNYSSKSFWKAQALVLNSVGRNATFNTWDGISGNAKKIRSLMDKMDVLKESKNEIYKPSAGRLFKRIGERVEWMNPYSPQSRSEYINQAPIMIAMMMDTVVKTKEGKEISLWEAYDINGELRNDIELDQNEITTKLRSKYDTETKEFIGIPEYSKMLDLKTRTDKLVKMNHGNYDPDSPLSLKRIWFGRALSQFRTWAFQGFAERFKEEFTDYQLTNRLTGEGFVKRKGRYRSYGAFYNIDNPMMAFGRTFQLVYKPLGKLIGFKPNFDSLISEDGKFTEVDAANMRKNMAEIALYIMITAFTLALKAAVEDDDKDKKKILAFNFLINQSARLSTDIMFYTNPVEFDRLLRNAIPAFSLVVDAQEFLVSAWRLIEGEEDILQSGPNEGESRAWRDFKKLIPGPVQVEKIKSASQQIYKKN